MKAEQELIKLRIARKKKFNVWEPTAGEFNDLAMAAWETILKEENYSDEEKIRGSVRIYYRSQKEDKFFAGLKYLYGEFVGKPLSQYCGIVLYMDDILAVNLFQRDLVAAHLYFIIKHELAHWFGTTHEEMDKINDFAYPGVKS